MFLDFLGNRLEDAPSQLLKEILDASNFRSITQGFNLSVPVALTPRRTVIRDLSVFRPGSDLVERILLGDIR